MMKLLVFLCVGAFYHAMDASAFSIDHLVDTTKPEHAAFLDSQREIADVNAKIDQAQRNRKDPIDLCTRKSQLEDDFIATLKLPDALYYQGDDLWYYRMTKNPHDLALLTNDPVHGPVFKLLNTKRPINSLGLTCRLVYLVSFNQIENICGFASVANAAALEEQLKAGKPVTFAETRRLAEANVDKIKNLMKSIAGGIEYAGDADLVKAATDLGISQDVLEFLSKDNVTNLHNRLKNGEKVDRNNELVEKITRNPMTHIMYNVGGGHWVELLVAKEAETYTLYLLNSSNAPLDERDDVVVLLRYFDDLIQRVYIAEALAAVDKGSFEKCLKKVTMHRVALLEELTKEFIAASDAQKPLLCEKIDACAESVRLNMKPRDLPKSVSDFLIQQADNKAFAWPNNFLVLVASCKTPVSNGQKPQSLDKGNQNIVIGLIIGIASFALYRWLATEKQEKKPGARKAARAV